MRGGTSLSKINVGLALRSLNVGKEIDGYGGVIIHVGKGDDGGEIIYTAGDISGNSGYVLETDNPIGTQEMANAIYASLVLRGAKYRAFSADTVHIDPAFEVGDGITANNTDAVIWASRMNLGRQIAPSLGAPFDEEIDHEFAYVSKQEREFTREKEYTRARFRITATEISAKVSKEGGNPSSFGWTLTDHDWTLYSNGSTVLKATSAGLEVNGKITATSGVIGGVRIENGVLSGIRGGTGGNLAENTLSNWNMEGGINTNLGYGASYGAALSGLVPANEYFLTSLIYQGRGVQWVNLNGVYVLGRNQ